MTETATHTTTASPRRPRVSALERGTPLVEVVIPVLDEEAALEASVRRVVEHVGEHLPFTCRVTVADNASTDGTEQIGRRLAEELDGVRYLRLDAKGRGRALRAAWLGSDAAVVAYMDVDLSTDLSALLPLVAPLLAGHSEVAIGTRLHRASRVVRGPKREMVSRCYNLLLRTFLRARFTDAQCGFKAVRRDVATAVLPAVVDDEWFFDTELLVLAERLGMRVHEVPVDWTDDPDSSVHIVDTALKDLRGMWRIRRPSTQTSAVTWPAPRVLPASTSLLRDRRPDHDHDPAPSPRRPTDDGAAQRLHPLGRTRRAAPPPPPGVSRAGSARPSSRCCSAPRRSTCGT